MGSLIIDILILILGIGATIYGAIIGEIWLLFFSTGILIGLDVCCLIIDCMQRGKING